MKGLHYGFIRQGILPPNEEAFFKEVVVPHFATGPTITMPNGEPVPHGKIHIEVADPDKAEFTVADLRSKAELSTQKTRSM